MQVAREALKAAAAGKAYNPPAVADTQLLEEGAAFVTLHKHGELRGCIGSLEAYQPLIEDVAENARSAALRDPRFPPVTPDEVAAIHIEISVLTKPEPMYFKSEDDLLEQIQPYEDGLVLQEGRRRGTFLPLVWQQLPDKKEFLMHLKHKAGLPVDYWSESVRVYRYRTQVFEENRSR